MRLRYAGYSTQHIWKLVRYRYDFAILDAPEQYYYLRKFNETLRIKDKALRINRFIHLDMSHIKEELGKSNIHTVSIHDAAYPRLLKEISDPPLILFYRGNKALLNHINALAIIGARQATDYTKRILTEFAPTFKQHHFVIVSGLAKGADHMAHEMALTHHIPTIGVLGFGHLTHYPATTQYARQRIERCGVVISEYLPTDKPRTYRFPERNRIISGLSQAILVTEFKLRSGAQITVDLALEQNRDVYVIPGRIFDEMSQGNLACMKQGAKVITSAEDIIEDFVKN